MTSRKQQAKLSKNNQTVARSVGLLGGTFDPPHNGHLYIADQVKHRLKLDEIWLVVAHQPWQKVPKRPVSSSKQRLTMVNLALSDQKPENIFASDIEIQTGGPSYTIETIEQLTSDRPDFDWTWVIGSDNVEKLDTWHRADELRNQMNFAVVERPGSPVVQKPGWNLRNVELSPLQLSSTQLRGHVRKGWPIRYLTPSPVATYIAANGLYKDWS